MVRIAWDRFEWHSGPDAFSFEVENEGLYGTLTHIGGQKVTLPMVAWEGLLDCVGLERGARTTRVSDLPQRSGARWTETETTRLLAAFGKGRTIEQLAESHARTVVGIEGQLEKLGVWNRLEHRPLATPDHLDRAAWPAEVLALCTPPAPTGDAGAARRRGETG